jgi:ribose transport system substrate-binding protein
VLITGVDGQDFAIAEVAKGGNWIATVRQDWPVISATVLDLIEAHFAGDEPAETVVYVPAVVITAENACL